MNSKVDLNSPIRVILYDGFSFEFYIFERSTRTPKFSRGAVGNPLSNTKTIP